VTVGEVGVRKDSVVVRPDVVAVDEPPGLPRVSDPATSLEEGRGAPIPRWSSFGVKKGSGRGKNE
jgi:hypothetical protein